MKINIEVIPHKKQRYDTKGDYFKDGKNLVIKISKSNFNDEWLTIIHEIAELALVLKRKISIKNIDKFDMFYRGDDPGMDKKAPYHKEHLVANKIEDILSKELKHYGKRRLNTKH